MRHLNMNLLPRGLNKKLDYGNNAQINVYQSKKYTYILYLTRMTGDKDRLWRLDNNTWNTLQQQCRGTMYENNAHSWVVFQSEHKPYACGNTIR